MRLGNFRDGKGLSQKRIMDLYAKHTGEISSGIDETKKGSSMSRYENGKRGIDLVFLVWLAQEFHVDLHWLLTGETWEAQDEVVQKVKEWYRQGEQIFQNL